MTEQSIPTSEILNRAADLIQERGWQQGDWGTDDSAHSLCLEGGIMAALGMNVGQRGDLWRCSAYTAVADHLNRPAADTRRHRWNREVWAFNDDDGRTASEVIEVLRAAAAIEQARESDVAPLATTQREVSA